MIEEALAVAGVDPESVGYVEAHGSGTELGDPVEVAALMQAFGATAQRQFCALGSVKTGIGHLDAAAGAAGLIKAALAVERGEIPPSLHFTAPNPRIDFASSPFFVNTVLRPWPGGPAAPRRAGVSSFGIGGTNAHMVLEEAPEPEPSAPARRWHLLPLSARTPAALEAATDRLAAHLRAHPEQSVADVAHTLQVGRRAWEHRRVVVARDGAEAAAALERRSPGRVFGGEAHGGTRPVAFLFPGLGSHHAGMGRGLYDSEPVFRETVDRCAERLRPHMGLDLRDVLYPGDPPTLEEEDTFAEIDLRALLGRSAAEGEPADGLNRTGLAQPALFVTEYALALLWMHWGVVPQAMLGHSLGEHVAATVAGVWSLEDALLLAAERARLVEALPEGGMMGVTLPEAEVRPLLRGGLCVAALNGPDITVVSGPAAAVDELQAEVASRGLLHRRLPVRHAFHSPMMEPVAERLAELLGRVRMHPPRIPFVSNVTGEWIRPEEATDPAYWARQMCMAVRFSEGVETLARDGARVHLEVGPGHGLRALVWQHPAWGDARPVVAASLRHGFERYPESAHLLGAAGRLWTAGAAVDWKAVHAHERLRRIPLPTYPFERRRYWLERKPGEPAPAPEAAAPGGADPAEWLYLPAWTRAPLPAPAEAAAPAEWLVLADEAGIGAMLAGRLEALGHVVAVAHAGKGFGRAGERGYTARPGSADDLAALGDALRAAGIRPRRVVHLWGIDPGEGADAFVRAQERGYATVAAIAATFARDRSEGPLRLVVVTEGAQDVSGAEGVHLERATVLGACLALPHEHPHVACRIVDVRLGAGGEERLAEQLLAEVASDASELMAALRGSLRWVRSHAPAHPRRDAVGVRRGGAYLFTSGLEAAGDVLAEHLAQRYGARIAVVVDPSFPAQSDWDARLAAISPADPVALTIRGIRAAETRETAPLLLRAAPGDAAALRAAVEEAVRTFGALHGVVHAVRLSAGPGAGLAEAPPGAAAAELARVARELAALEEATAGVAPDFLVLQNSIFSVLGGPRLAVVTAACVLIGAWTERRAAEGKGRWISVEWDRWHLDEGEDPAARTAYTQGAILRGECARAFERAAALAGEPRVVVSTRDLDARLAELRTPRWGAALGRPGAEAALHPRPELSDGYQAPRNPAEEVLAGVWRELLGIGEIGVHDNFFHLGGHSLLGMQLLSRLRDAFQVELPLRAVFEAPTIAALAELVDEAIVLELEGMSDEEAEALAGAPA